MIVLGRRAAGEALKKREEKDEDRSTDLIAGDVESHGCGEWI